MNVTPRPICVSYLTDIHQLRVLTMILKVDDIILHLHMFTISDTLRKTSRVSSETKSYGKQLLTWDMH
ncbi:unnamed protein product [Lathyrus sativus]|nr:unnamed protein product [Lathyrus sativus]